MCDYFVEQFLKDPVVNSPGFLYNEYMDKTRVIKFLDQGINWLFLGIVFVIPAYFAYWQETFNVFDINKVTVARIGISLILFGWLIKAVLEEKIFYYLRSLLIFSGLILLVYVFNGVVFSVKPQLSLWGNYERQQGVYSLIYYWLFFVLLISWLKNWQQIKALLLAVVVGSWFVCLYGLAQNFNLDPLKWSTNEGRIFSSLGQPNFLGHYLVIILPLTIYYALVLAKKKWLKWLVWLIVLMQLVCLLFTTSRSAWLGILAAGIVGVILWTWFNGKRKLIGFFLIGIILVIVGLNMLASYDAHNGQTNRYLSRFSTIFSLNNIANKTRLFYWGSAYDIWCQASPVRKIIGYGKDTQSSNYLSQYRTEWGDYEMINSFPDRAHNNILDIVLEFGLSGLLVFLAFNGYLVWQALKYLHKNKLSDDSGYLVLALLSSLTAYAIADSFGFSLTTHYLYYYLMVALLCLVVFGQSRRVISLARLSLVFRWIVALSVIFFVAFFLYFFTISSFVADLYFMKAKKAEARYDCLGAMDNMNKAVSWQPTNFYYKEQYIFIHNNCFPSLTNKNDMIIVLNNILAQIDSYPESEYGYHIIMNTAHAYSIFGYYLDKKYYIDAQNFYLKLIALNPDISVNYQDYGRMKAWAGDYQSAIKIYEDGLKVTPPVGSPNGLKQIVYFKQLIAQAYEKLGNLDKALEYYLEVEKLQPEYILVYNDIAKIYQTKKQPDKAIEYFKKGLKLAPEDVAWSFNLAIYYSELGRFKEARPYAEEALKLNPTDQATINLTKEIQAKVK